MKVNCSNCGKEIDRKPSQLKKTKNTTCSLECRSVVHLKIVIQRLENDFKISLCDFLIKEYQENKRSYRYINEKLGITDSRTTRNLLNYYNIPIRHGTEAVKTQWINADKRKNKQAEFLRNIDRTNLFKVMQTDEYKEKLRLANSGENNGVYGRTGELSSAWQGGKTKLKKYLRESINDWRLKHFQEANYQCDITGDHANLVVHHLDKSFSQIRDEILDEMGISIDLNNPIENIDTDTLNEICQRVKEAHENVKGVVLSSELHILFHKTYGFRNNTEQQYYKFKEKYIHNLKETA